MKILLKNGQSPGDILMLTATVRDLKASHPEFAVNCSTSAQELWQNNPHLDRSVTQSNCDRVIDMHYPLINSSTQGGYHFFHGFRLYLEEQLGVKIPAGNFRVDLHLSGHEKNDPYIMNAIGPDDGRPCWLVDAGHKKDFTCKMWEFARFQEVVNRTSDRIKWIQIGSLEHNHRALENVINMVGKTSHRQLVSLMYRSSGVLTPVSYPMHLATMQWHGHSDSDHRPCVVIAGSREPSVWEAYTCHQFIHNCGMLDCSRSGACWKSRIVPLNDGDKKDTSLCLKPVICGSGQTIPRCLDMITAEEVIRRIYMYLDSGLR